MKPPRYRKASSGWPFRCSNCRYMGSSGLCTKYRVTVARNYTCKEWDLPLPPFRRS